MRQITVYTIDELTEIDHLNLSEKHAECVVFCSTVNAIAHALAFCNIFDYAVENGFITPQTEPSKIFVPDNYGDSSDEEVLRKAEEWLGKNFDFAESLVQAINNYGCEFFEDGTLYQ